MTTTAAVVVAKRAMLTAPPTSAGGPGELAAQDALAALDAHRAPAAGLS